MSNILVLKFQSMSACDHTMKQASSHVQPFKFKLVNFVVDFVSSVCRPDSVLPSPGHCPAAGHVQDRHPVPGQVEDAGSTHHHSPHQGHHVRYVRTAGCFRATILCQLHLA